MFFPHFGHWTGFEIRGMRTVGHFNCTQCTDSIIIIIIAWKKGKWLGKVGWGVVITSGESWCKFSQHSYNHHIKQSNKDRNFSTSLSLHPNTIILVSHAQHSVCQKEKSSKNWVNLSKSLSISYSVCWTCLEESAFLLNVWDNNHDCIINDT